MFLDIYKIIFSLKQSNLHVVYLILIHDLFHFPRITQSVEASGLQQGSCCLLRFSSWVEWYAKRSEDLLEVIQRGKSVGSAGVIALHFYSSQDFALSTRLTFSSKDTKSVLNISNIPRFLGKGTSLHKEFEATLLKGAMKIWRHWVHMLTIRKFSGNCQCGVFHFQQQKFKLT